ncbi:hypothetical protein AcetOrient_orf01976 [Acetobacter orientalis]|uniref:Uncharacterized protein n=1 Tax=Acetobacter orientalis TaxID=146474 RepID=A0A2Z5ZGX3_9PROT|nr:hypothetical protein AcetOrient_orf01976 [Acetobacter orientalis]
MCSDLIDDEHHTSFMQKTKIVLAVCVFVVQQTCSPCLIYKVVVLGRSG